MTDSKKLLVFGSFTEDETKSLLLKKSSGSAEKPVKKNELQFGSINFSGGKFIPESDGESNKQFSANGPLNFQPSIKKTSNENSSVVAVSIPKENRIVNKPAATHPLDNGLKEQKINHNGVSDECSVQSSKVLIEKVADGFCQVPTVSR